MWGKHDGIPWLRNGAKLPHLCQEKRWTVEISSRNLNALIKASTYLYPYLPVFITTYLYTNLPIHLPTCLYNNLPIHQPIYTSTYLYTYLPLPYLPIHLPSFLKNGPTPASFSCIFVFSNKHYEFYNKY